MSGAVNQEENVLVVGAGPVGLVMACELFRHGVPCRIIDQDKTAAGESRAIVVQARTLEVFEGMGIIDAVLARGRKIHQANIYCDNKRLTQLSFDELDSPYPFILVLPQNELEELLIDHLRHLGGQVEWQKKLLDLTQDDWRVSATVDEQEEIRAAWLIGCDGMESDVSKALSIPCQETSHDELFLLIDIKMQWDLAADEVHQFLLADGLLAAFPLPGVDCWRLIVESGGAMPAEPSLLFVEQLLQKAGVVGSLIGTPIWLAAYRVNRRLASQFQLGRCFLAGDAAHTYSPVGGQGMNMGIQDAYNLAWKLGAVVQRRAWEWLLKSYHNERYPIAEATLRVTDRATKVVMLRHPVSLKLRKRASALLSHFEVIQQRITRRLVELDLSYQQSSIVEEFYNPLLGSCLHLVDKEIPTATASLEFGAAPRAGERAPDVVLAPDRRLFEILRGTKHSLFLFSGASPREENYQALEEIAQQICLPYGQNLRIYLVVPFNTQPKDLSWNGSLLFDSEGTFHRRYGVYSGGMYLIRPDGHIGFRSQPILKEVFAAYLQRTFIGQTTRVI